MVGFPRVERRHARPYEGEREYCAAAAAVADDDRAAMRFDDARYDGKPQPGASRAPAIAAPEAAEDEQPVLGRDARAVIGDADDAGGVDLDLDGGPRRRMGDR